jgi:AraC-like DNA-binding protein
MTLHIKNMVCPRCIMAVRQLLVQLEIPYTHLDLGTVTLVEELTAGKLDVFSKELHSLGFSLIDDRKGRIIEKIKNTIITHIRDSENQEEEHRHNLSGILSARLHYDYNYLSNLFSEIEGTTIEKYIIAQKTERVKELLVYDELTLNEIAYRLGYSSTAHLSSQFKKVTGLSPSHFKKIKENKRRSLDEI